MSKDGNRSAMEQRVSDLPSASGVYLFKDLRGRVLYVGKAVDLRARVRQYLAGSDERIMVPLLVSEAADVEVVVTHTEKEALLLENTLIKKHRPRYNVRLRDDSNFLHLRLDPGEEWPRYTLVRRVRADGARYFGPYASASRARQTLAFLQRTLPLRSCTDAVLRTRRRPCLLFQMGRCTAPCVGAVEQEAYRELVEESFMLLEGRDRQLVQRLRARMRAAAEAEEFERAARLRDLLRSLEAALERQDVIDTRLGDRDAWGVYLEGRTAAVAALPVREGAVGEPWSQLVRDVAGDEAELLSSAINATYSTGDDIPAEVLVQVSPRDAAALAEVLAERRGKKVRLHAPVRGHKAQLVALARENARVRFLQDTDAEERHREALERLGGILGLASPPRRMECFDNSNLQGTTPVAAMAVFVDGRPARPEYRRYKVKTVEGADDYATMAEILGRRVRRGLVEGGMPDVIVVDGGRGQLAVARAVLAEHDLVDQPVVGLAKPRAERRRGDARPVDKIVLPGRTDPVVLEPADPALRILQHLRDEAHRHAVTYHRKKRRAERLSSVLEDIPGVGPARRRALLSRLGSARAVLQADEAALASVPGIGPALAAAIHRALHPE